MTQEAPAHLPEVTTLQELQQCQVIALVSDNHTCWTRWGNEEIRTAKALDQFDAFCQFQLSVDAHSRLSLQADNGMYLSRWSGSTASDTFHPADAAQSQARDIGGAFGFADTTSNYLRPLKRERDQFCQFLVARYPSGDGFTLKGDNNRYVSRWHDHELRVEKVQPDAYTAFRIYRVK